MHRLVVGIDAGGTNVRLRYADENGTTVTEVQGRACNDYGPDSLAQLIAPCDIKASDVRAVYAGVAGISRPGMRQRWDAELTKLFPQAGLTLVPDFIIAFHGALEQSGILVIAGTGSIIYGEHKGKSARVGGRGWEWGDWGSGTWITSELLRMTLNSFDGLAKRTKLVDRVCNHLGAKDALMACDEARRLCAEQGRGFLVPAVLAAAQEGDADALDLFEKAAHWLALQVEATAEQIAIGKTESCAVATVGGLWDCGEPLLNPFIRYLKESYAGICVNKPISEPLEGATRQAIKSMKQVSA